jgi:hypothetical protein
MNVGECLVWCTLDIYFAVYGLHTFAALLGFSFGLIFAFDCLKIKKKALFSRA